MFKNALRKFGLPAGFFLLILIPYFYFFYFFQMRLPKSSPQGSVISIMLIIFPILILFFIKKRKLKLGFIKLKIENNFKSLIFIIAIFGLVFSVGLSWTMNFTMPKVVHFATWLQQYLPGQFVPNYVAQVIFILPVNLLNLALLRVFFLLDATKKKSHSFFASLFFLAIGSATAYVLFKYLSMGPPKPVSILQGGALIILGVKKNYKLGFTLPFLTAAPQLLTGIIFYLFGYIIDKRWAWFMQGKEIIADSILISLTMIFLGIFIRLKFNRKFPQAVEYFFYLTAIITIAKIFFT